MGNVKIIAIAGYNYGGNWNHTRTACRGIIIQNNRILMSYETLTDQWMIPGGGLEEGEDERACCIRACSESS